MQFVDQHKTTFNIRHRIAMGADGFRVIENFADQPAIVWDVSTRELAYALVEERKTMLLKMISRISKEAADAVANARHIDQLGAGHG
jgi:hypothetical protein